MHDLRAVSPKERVQFLVHSIVCFVALAQKVEWDLMLLNEALIVGSLRIAQTNANWLVPRAVVVEEQIEHHPLGSACHE